MRLFVVMVISPSFSYCVKGHLAMQTSVREHHGLASGVVVALPTVGSPEGYTRMVMRNALLVDICRSLNLVEIS